MITLAQSLKHKVSKECLFVCFQGNRHDAAGHSLPGLGPDRKALMEARSQPDRAVLVSLFTLHIWSNSLSMAQNWIWTRPSEENSNDTLHVWQASSSTKAVLLIKARFRHFTAKRTDEFLLNDSWEKHISAFKPSSHRRSLELHDCKHDFCLFT